MFHCSKCKFTSRKLHALRQHHKAEHPTRRTAPLPGIRGAGETAVGKVDYSFFNSPRELVLDLGEYRISITKK